MVHLTLDAKTASRYPDSDRTVRFTSMKGFDMSAHVTLISGSGLILAAVAAGNMIGIPLDSLLLGLMVMCIASLIGVTVATSIGGSSADRR